MADGVKGALSIAIFALLAAAAALAPLLPGSAPVDAGEPASWPRRFDGRPLTPLPRAPEDRILAGRFPGRIARFSDGRRQVVLRRVEAATRRLHPASDCFRAIGYDVAPAPMRLGPGGGPASCFTARRGGRAFLACEQLRDRKGRSWPDVSSWYWSALLGTSRGPWLASLTVERIAA
jgi:hypothetical protein